MVLIWAIKSLIPFIMGITESTEKNLCELCHAYGEMRGKNPTNVLTYAEAFDPLAKISEFKVSAVNIAKLSE